MATNLTEGEKGLGPFLRDLKTRLERIETRRTVIVGDYRLEMDLAGKLIATHLTSQASKVLFDPAEEQPEV